MCYRAEFGGSRSNRIRLSSEEPAKLESASATPPWDMEGLADRLNKPFPRVTKAEFCRSALKGVGINKR